MFFVFSKICAPARGAVVFVAPGGWSVVTMENPELSVIAVNIFIICIAYFYVYPKYCGSNANKIAVNDLIASAIALLISGYRYWGAGVEFGILVTSVNWFWFTLLTYLIVELFLMFWYFRKHGVWDSFNT